MHPELIDIRTITFDQFTSDDPGLFRLIPAIAYFNFRVKLPQIGVWVDKASAQRVGYRVYDYLGEVLEEARFYAPDEIEVSFTELEVKISYTNPENPFDIVLDEKGWLTISTRGSSLKRFHNWFINLMPSAHGIVQMLITSAVDEIKKTSGFERSLAIQTASFEWRIIAYDFRDSHGKSVKNIELVRKAVPLVPDAAGRLTQLSEQEYLGRTEFQVSRWINPGQEGRREIYRVSAPSNNEWSSLWFYFHYIGDVYIGPNGSRVPFDPDHFYGPRDLYRPYVEFFRDRALRGFVASITDGHQFTTTSYDLP